MLAIATKDNETLARGASSRQQVEFPALRDPRYPVHCIADRLEPYLRVIVEKFQPEKIILFGSYAQGNPNEHSDVDLLIIRRDVPSERQSEIEIRSAGWGLCKPPLSFTIISKTPASLQDQIDQGSFFFSQIVQKGLVLHAT